MPKNPPSPLPASSAPLADQGEDREIDFTAAAGLRPELHRYCARMVGSAIDGEDIVQDVFAAVYRSPPPLRLASELRRWLFRAAHNRALDHLRRYERRMGQSLEAAGEVTDDGESPDRVAARKETVTQALTHYLVLPPAQRGCLIFKEVFDYSLEEIAELLDLTVPAVKSAMLRGRKRLATVGATAPSEMFAVATEATPSPRLLRYSDFFNARDWDGLRQMLVGDVHLELVSRWEKRGRESVSSYFGNYSSLPHWQVRPAQFEGREALAFFSGENSTDRPDYVILLNGIGPGVTHIRDFRHASYILAGSEVHFSR